MRIAISYICKVPPETYGGASRVIYYLCKGLSELGHEVFYIGPGRSKIPGCKSIEVPKEVFEGIDVNVKAPDIKEYIPKGTDILHIHYLSDVDAEVPIIKTIHGYPLHCDNWWGLGFPYFYDDTCIFLSDAHRRTAQRPNNPFVYNGIDVNDYEFSENKERFLLFLSRVDWSVKGVFYAIEIAKRSGLPLIIAGNIDNPGFYPRLKEHLTSNIQYIGPVGGRLKKELLSKAMALLFPTLWPEPFGLVVIEALASGTPVITTYFGAMPEIVSHGKVGFMSLSVIEAVEQLKKIDAIDPYICRSYVEENFNYLIMAKRYEKLYKNRLKTQSYTGI